MKVSLDLTNVADKRDSKVDYIPAGQYLSRIIEVEAAQNSKQTGNMLKVYFAVIGGEHDGKVFMESLNVVHQNKETQRIALESLKDIMRKGGHKNPNHLGDTDELLGLTVEAVLTDDNWTNDKGEEVKKTKVVKYKSYDGSTKQTSTTPTQTATTATTVSTPQSTPAPTFPWGKQ
jgi:hypothetical protein